MSNLNRRDLLKTLAVLPVAGTAVTSECEWPHIVGVTETPWLKGKVNVFCDGKPVERVVRCSVQGGWCEVFPEKSRGETGIIRGDVRIEWKDA